MRTVPHSESRHTGWLILGLFAIPVAAVSSAALLGDIASTTDPTAALVGIPAVLGGVVMGALVFRLARVVHSGAIALGGVLFRTLAREIDLLSTTVRGFTPAAAVLPVVVLVPASVGRRGPPHSSR